MGTRPKELRKAGRNGNANASLWERSVMLCDLFAKTLGAKEGPLEVD
jgi:hypothetical protein